MTDFIHDKYTLKAIEVAHEGRSFFITGKAGTGKTMLLHKIVEEEKSYGKKIAVCAPTGVAAKNAGGVTIHSLLKVPISIYIPGHKVYKLFNLSDEERLIVRMLDMLIIDEVSMVRCDLIDMVDEILRHYRDNEEPFGGLQVIMFGDLRQLMPVVTEEDWNELGKYYKAAYFFCSKVIMGMRMPMLELTKVYRQSDTKFISLLNRVREGILTDNDERLLKTKYKKDFEVSDTLHYIRLTTHRSKAWKYNKSKLEQLRGNEQEYKAYIDGYYPKEDYPNDYYLRLKVNARVMFIANDKSGRYVNGTLGTVEYADDDSIVVCTDEGKIIDVYRTTWEIYHYKINRVRKEVERTLLGSFTQYPLQLAWAVTIHKSQGLTFEKVIIDAGRAFTYGQVYVALSRCKTLEGIVLTSRITPEVVTSDPLVLEYMQLVEHIWPDEDVRTDDVDSKQATQAFITKYEYKPIGYVFKSHWDGLYYDCWEAATQNIYLDRLVEQEGKLRRLCVGQFPQKSPLFNILSHREYANITSVNFKGGKSTVVTAIVNGTKTQYNYQGRECLKYKGTNIESPEVWDFEPILRTYTFVRNGDSIKITKTSKLSTSNTSEIKDFSDMGKLLLCCDCYKILRNDGSSYDVGVDSDTYKVLHFSMSGKALDDSSRMISDKWYQKNPNNANIKKSYEMVPETRSRIRQTVTKPVKHKQPVVTPKVNRFTKYPPQSIERKILECMQDKGYRNAREIANAIGFTKTEVNSKLYGVLSQDGFVENVFNTWNLKK